MNRRQLLAAGISVSAVGAVGCLDGSPPTVRLAGVTVMNFMDDPVSVDVVVRKDDVTVQTDAVELEAVDDGSSLTSSPLTCIWDDDPGEYVIEGRLNDGEWMGTDTLEILTNLPEDDREVAAVRLEIYSEAEIVFNPHGCDLLTTGTIPPWTCSWVDC